MTLVLLLCFCWMHFWWCGVVCVATLMEESQGVEEEDKDEVVWNYGEGIQHVFNKGGDK